MSPRRLRAQRSQSLTEFALVAPLLLFLLFGIVDFGRVVYVYVTIAQAANEGVRISSVASTPLADNANVQTAVQSHASDVQLAVTCPNGPITAANPPPNTGWLFITQPNPPGVAQISQPLPVNAPGGEPAANQQGGCSVVNPAFANEPLQLTIRYNYEPLTPFVRDQLTNRIILTATAVYRIEY